MALKKEMEKQILIFQKNEITEYHIYNKLSRKIKSDRNSKILAEIADDEYSHYNRWREISGKEVKPNRIKIYWYYFMSLIFGLTFSLKLLERGEEAAQSTYELVMEEIPESRDIINDEKEHEEQLLGIIEEERLKYVGSIVLGLNDALVELTGTLAGLTFALKDNKIIAMAGLITGLAASF